MTGIAALVALAVLAAPPQRAAPGGYGETTWGMSLAHVRKIHPSGATGKTPLGLTVYRVSGRVEPVGPALLEFMFGDDQLISVDVKIPAPGTVVDPQTGGLVSPTDAQALEIWVALRKAVEARYGKPTGQGGSVSFGARTARPANTLWDVPGTTIQLALEDRPGQRIGVTLSYVDPAYR